VKHHYTIEFTGSLEKTLHKMGAIIEIGDLMKDKQVVFFNFWSYFRLTD
jgi:hypothetical protein